MFKNHKDFKNQFWKVVDNENFPVEILWNFILYPKVKCVHKQFSNWLNDNQLKLIKNDCNTFLKVLKSPEVLLKELTNYFVFKTVGIKRLVDVHSIFFEKGKIGYQMEKLFPWGKGVEISKVLEILTELKTPFKNGIALLHGDFIDGNIMFTKNGDAKLIDFGESGFFVNFLESQVSPIGSPEILQNLDGDFKMFSMVIPQW